MMHFTILCVGSLKEKYMKEAVADYTGRLSHYVKIDTVEVPEGPTLKKEGEALLSKIPDRAFVAALDLKGKMYSSEALAELIDRQAASGYSRFVFMIGGSEGFDPEVLKAADVRICMSEMTFPHQLARLMLTEQLYRAMKINSGEKYHK